MDATRARWLVLLLAVTLGCKEGAKEQGDETAKAAGDQPAAASADKSSPPEAKASGGCIEACALLEQSDAEAITGKAKQTIAHRCRKTATLISECQYDSEAQTPPTSLRLVVDDSVLPNGKSNRDQKVEIWKAANQKRGVKPHPDIPGGFTSAWKNNIQLDVLFIQDGYVYQLIATRISKGFTADEIDAVNKLAKTIADRGKSAGRVSPE